MKIQWLFLCLFMTWSACESYKILVVFPMAGKSHSILGNAVVKHLADAGHQITYIQGFPLNKPHPNVTEILPIYNTKEQDNSMIDLSNLIAAGSWLQTIMSIMMMFMMPSMNAEILEDPKVQELLQDPTQKFDVIVAEWMFADFYSSLQPVYQCPFIWFSTVDPHWQVIRLIDDALHPAYNADVFTSDVAPFTFWERASQLLIQTRGTIFLRIALELERRHYNRAIVPILEKHGKPVPCYDDVVYNASLMLGNSHVSMGAATRLPQSYKPVGGYHIEKEVKPLPDDLKQLLDNAKDGLIYFSMGSNLKSKDIPKSIKESLLNVFRELKQTVLWKLEEVWPDLPKNVHIVTWAPQQSILAHPNTILFISHGGLLSTTETIHYGKPIIGIPVFGDQHNNVEKAVKRGFAQRVDLAYDMEHNLRAAIKEMLSNPKYSQKAKEWSQIYHDRPVTPDRELVHWVEHVARMGGAPHLRSAALMVPWYQKMFIDILLVFLIVLVLSYKVLKLVCRCIKSYFKKSKVKVH